MKKTIARWLRNVADKLTGEQTIDIAIATEDKFNFSSSEVLEKYGREQLNQCIEYQCAKSREYVSKCIIEGVRKASFEGILRWEEDITEIGSTIGARLRIIRPIK